MHFGITEKPTRDCISPYNNAGLISKVSEKIAIEKAENCRFRQPYCRLTPPPWGTSAKIRINLIPPETRVIRLHGSVFVQMFVVGSERRIFSATECVSAIQGHPSSLILSLIVTLVLSCTVFEIRRVIGSVWLKIADFSYPTLI